MNDFDKAGRYLVKRESAGFFSWLLDNPHISFRAWIDARRVALPNQHDLTNDLVAALESGGVLEAVCLELEAEARADAVTRSLEYQTRLWTERSHTLVSPYYRNLLRQSGSFEGSDRVS